MTAVLRSQNGWPCGRQYVASYTIPGTTRRVALRMGDVSVVLLDFLAWFHQNIESIDGGQLDDWGFAERPIRGSTTVYSNHFSGTGADVNALRHPLGKRGTFTAEQVRKIRAKLREYGGVIRWGGDYTGRADEMHFEVNAGATAVAREATRIRGRASVVVRPPVVRIDRHLGLADPPMTGADVRGVQRALVLAGNPGLLVDGVYGKATADLVNLFNRNRQIKGAGVTPETWAALRRVPGVHP